MKGFTTMYDHRGKTVGLIVSAVGLIGMITEKLKGFIVVKKWDVAQHYNGFEWLMLVGLFLIIYSKEKYDDERAKAIRLKSFQIAFALQQAVLLATALTGNSAKNKIQNADLFAFAGMGIIFYLLIFHVGLYFDFLWEYDDKGVWENLRNMGKNKWAKLVYLLICAVMLLLISML